MEEIINGIMVLVISTNLLLIGSGRIMMYIKTVAVQSFLLGFLPVIAFSYSFHSIFLGIIITVVKGVLLPSILLKIFRDVKIFREDEPFVGFSLSLLSGTVLFIFSFILAQNLEIPARITSDLVLPASLFSIFIGLFVIISRKKAISQVMGYLTLENGIYILALIFVGDIPMYVELGILLDLFVAVLIMGIAIHKIMVEFNHIDSDKLSNLRG